MPKFAVNDFRVRVVEEAFQDTAGSAQHHSRVQLDFFRALIAVSCALCQALLWRSCCFKLCCGHIFELPSGAGLQGRYRL